MKQFFLKIYQMVKNQKVYIIRHADYRLLLVSVRHSCGSNMNSMFFIIIQIIRKTDFSLFNLIFYFFCNPQDLYMGLMPVQRAVESLTSGLSYLIYFEIEPTLS